MRRFTRLWRSRASGQLPRYWSWRDPAEAASFVAALAAQGLTAVLAKPEPACRRADIVVTAPPTRALLFEADWIRPGTHVASMGSDAAGKQELPPAIFCDLPAKAVVMGDLQHFSGDRSRIIAIGDV